VSINVIIYLLQNFSIIYTSTPMKN